MILDSGAVRVGDGGDNHLKVGSKLGDVVIGYREALEHGKDGEIVSIIEEVVEEVVKIFGDLIIRNGNVPIQ